MSAVQSMGASEQAAIVVLLLEETEAADVLGRLRPDELQRLGTAMCALTQIESQAIGQALNGFMAEAALEALPTADRVASVHGLMTRAVGDHRARYLMQRIQPDGGATGSLEIARWLAPRALLDLVGDEPPQVLAVLVLLLDTQAGAQFLALLPPAVRPLVVERVARLESVPAPARELLGALLERRMTERFGAAALRMGGPREAAGLINLVSGGLERDVLPAIAQNDADLAGAIEAELVTFAMLLDLDPQAIGRLLRDADNTVLVDALKGLDEAAREPFFAAMSARAADGVRDEIALRGRIRRTEVDAAQAALVALARRLSAAGELSLGKGDGDFV